MRLLYKIRQPVTLYVLLTVLAVISYGKISSRGGYADDFPFANYAASQSYLEGVLNWKQEINSRISQSVILLGLLHLSDLDNLESYNWTMFHGIGILAFLISLFFINCIFVIVEVPARSRFIALLFFALHPIKNQALLWPCCISGYIIPFMIFSLATWLYLARAKVMQERVWSLLIVFSLLSFVVMSIEQLLPLIVFIVLLRLLMYSSGRRLLVMNLSGLIMVVSAFLVTALFSKNLKLSHGSYSEWNLLQIVTHAFEIFIGAARQILEHPIRIFLDNYYWDALLESAGSVLFLVAVITLLILMVIFAYQMTKNNFDKAPMRKLIMIAICGSLMFLVTISPLIVVDYYLPPRVLFIPFLGIALVIGAMFEMLWQKCILNWLRYAVIILIGGVTAIFILINLLDQNGLAKYWSMEKSIIKDIQQMKHEVPSHSEINLFNIPQIKDPMPSFVNNFAFPSITNMMFDDKTITGSTLVDISDVYPISEALNAQESTTLATPGDHVVCFWQKNSLIRIQGLQLQKVALIKTGNIEWQQILDLWKTNPKTKNIKGYYYPIIHEKNYKGGYSIQINSPIVLPETGMILLPTKIEIGKNKNVRLRLIIHAKRSGRPIENYDRPIADFSGFKSENGGLEKTIIISKIKDLELISISLSGRNGILQPDPADSSEQNNHLQGFVPIKFF